ncbi:MAG TPA: amidohydrolase, partial [Thermohalobaculum sp.]|nr:amidohydrolase [Thermohalobaculum sp.]
MSRQLYQNGTIRTLSGPGAQADWVLVGDGRILATGHGEPETGDAERIDLAGRTLVPGFIDPHGHFPDSGFNALFRVDLCTPPVGTCTSLAEALERLAQAPGQGWVYGAAFDQTALPERRFPTKAELDAIHPSRPAFVLHISGHAGVVNSAGLALLGRTGDGFLEGMAATAELGATDFGIDEAGFAAGVAAAAAEYISHGVTMAQNSWIEQRMLDRFVALDRAGGLPIDVVLLPAAELEPALSANLPQNLDHLILGPRKLFADGAFQVQTAFLSRPYHKPIDGDPNRRGMRYMPPDQLAAKVQALHRAGHQIHIHTNGDAASDDGLDAFETALLADPRADHRHTLIHAQTLRDDQLDRIARLGVTVSFFSAHVYFWGEMHHDVFLGPERAARISPARSALDRGIRITLHNDASVTPTRPLHLMWCAVERQTAVGRILGPEQRITPEEALRAHTIDAAWQVFQEHDRGSIETGKRADFAVLSDDPLTTAKPLKDIVVE